MQDFVFKGAYPQTRLRRLRRLPWLRDLHQENTLSTCDFVWPIFLRDHTVSPHIQTLPGVKRFCIEELEEALAEAVDLDIRAVALFPCVDPEKKDASGHEAFNPENLVCQALRLIKAHFPELGVITDVALDPYTCHGHDGLIIDDYVANDATLAALKKQALCLAEAGTDVLAPSDMMDGRVGVLRQSLDAAGFEDRAIFSYGAKYASALYGPFREAAGSAKNLGKASKATYQMNPANGHEALREISLDMEEGADAVIVKPGTFYLDIIRQVADTFPLPVQAYHVSGEYALLKLGAEAGLFAYERALMENLMAFKRAGAHVIWTYGACEAARLIKKGDI